jgi:hypothetical protein
MKSRTIQCTGTCEIKDILHAAMVSRYAVCMLILKSVLCSVYGTKVLV